MDRAQAADVLRRLHEAQNAMYAGGSAEAVGALLSEDVVWHVPGRNAIAGRCRGGGEVLDYFRRRRELASGSFRMHPRDLLVGEGDCVASLTDGSAVIDGVERHWSTVGLYRLREDGRIAACWLLPLDPAAFDAIWGAR